MKIWKKWIDHLRMKANDCDSKERDGGLKEHFINGIHHNDMMTEIIREPTAVKKSLLNSYIGGLKSQGTESSKGHLKHPEKTKN